MKLIQSIAVLTVLMFCNTAAQATLMNGSVLDFSAAPSSTIIPADGNGSWFALANYQPDIIGITSYQGLIIGTTQDATGGHAGLVDGSESPTINQAFNFFNDAAMLETKSPTSIISASGNQATIDFSGFGWNWGGVDASFYDPTMDSGIASIMCALDCSVGDTYMLDYIGHVPAGDPSSLGGLEARVHLEGTISSVPLPAAAWLYVSGLLAFGQFARKVKKS